MTGSRCTPVDAGLSLIELVVAMAVFALVAVMGLQSLTGTMRVSERLTQIDSETAALGNAIGLLRNDLTSVVPLLFYPPQAAPQNAVTLAQDGLSFALSLSGQNALVPAHTDRQRVEWHLDTTTAVLSRRQWPTLIPAQASQRSDDMPVLSDVRAFTLRSFWADVGWVAGTVPPLTTQLSATVVALDQDSGGAPAAAYYSMLPLAIEVTLQTQGHGDLRFVQTLR